jgi:alpha-N-acetylglucosaminidase
MIILDLFADVDPVYRRTGSYFFGKPFIWCMLHNFGGNVGMYGRLPVIAEEPAQVLSDPGSNMIGVGMTPEGINQNFIVYDFVTEIPWKKTSSRDLKRWTLGYIQRRYGLIDSHIVDAWNTLIDDVYSCSRSDAQGVPKNYLTLRPSLKNAQGTGGLMFIWKLIMFSFD